MQRRMFLFLIGLTAMPAFSGFRNAQLKVRRAGSEGSPNETREAPAVVEFVVTSDEPFPVRALDPILHVGSFEVRSYRYLDMENKSLLFTCGEPEQLEENARVWLQYGNDAETRTELGLYNRPAAE